MNRTAIPLKRLRLFLEGQCSHPARIVHVCCGAGALLGFLVGGFAPLWVLLFPFMMAFAVRLIDRWGWLEGVGAPMRPRLPLFPAVMAPLSALLIIPPFVLLGAMLFGLPAFLFAVVYEKVFGVGRRNGVDNLATNIAFCMTWLASLAIYCGLQTWGLKRLTGKRHSGLFLQLVGWVGILVALDFYIGTGIGWSSSGFPLQPVTAVIELWLADVVLLGLAGRSVGLWLARSAAIVTPKRT